MKKVWMINQYSVTPEYPASTRHYELAKYLAKYCAVTLWGSNFIHHNKRYRFSKWTVVKSEWMEGFRYLWLGAIAYRDNGVFRIVNMLLYALHFFIVGLFQREKPDVLIGSSPSLFTAFSAMLVAKCKKAVFILEVRDLWPDSLIDIAGDNQKLQIRVLRWMESVLYKQADKIIALTEGIQQRIMEKGIQSDKLFFLPNGIDLDTLVISTDLEAERQRLRKSFGALDHEFVCMYAGAHGPANDLAQIIIAAEVLNKDSRIKIVLMGEGVEKVKLQQMVKERGLERIVVFLPAVSKSLVNDYLSCGDAFLICLKDVPLFEGALPNKLFDYLLHDKPIISTVRGELQNFLEQNKLGQYGNIKEIGEFYLPTVIKKLVDTGFELPGQSGKEIVYRRYSREKQAEELANLIDELTVKRLEGL